MEYIKKFSWRLRMFHKEVVRTHEPERHKKVHLPHYIFYTSSRDSSVGKVTAYGLDD
jgi:hypothetical protein